GVERHSAFAVPLGTGDLGAAQATANLDLDAFGTLAHAVLHGALHGAAEHHTTLQLLGNVLGHQRGIQVGLAHFLDVDVDRHTHLRGDSCSQLVAILALLATPHAGTGGVNGDARGRGGTLDLDLARRSVGQLLVDELADLEVGVQLVRVILRA